MDVLGKSILLCSCSTLVIKKVEKSLVEEFVFNEVKGLQPATLLKKLHKSFSRFFILVSLDNSIHGFLGCLIPPLFKNAPILPLSKSGKEGLIIGFYLLYVL